MTTREAASGDIRTTARARAQRTVGSLSETSTMRAWPAASRWVSAGLSIPAESRVSSVVVTVRLFAGLRERAGSDRVQVELPEGARVSDLLAAMDVAPRSCVVAINREYADEAAPVREDDEVALVPPVSGGRLPRSPRPRHL